MAAGPLAPIGWGQPGNEVAAAYARGGHVSTLQPASSFANSSAHTPARLLHGSGQHQQHQSNKMQEVEAPLQRAELELQAGRCQEAVAIMRAQLQDTALLSSSSKQQQGAHHSLPGTGAGSGPGPPGSTERSGSSGAGGEAATGVSPRVRAALLLGAACYQLGQYGEAIAAYDAAILEAPGLAEAHSNLALALQAAGQLDLALLYYQSALRLDPSSVAAYNNMGGALAAQGLAGPALCAYALALSLDPQRAEVHANMGDVWRSQGPAGWPMARTCYSAALSYSPCYGPALRGLGDLARESGDYGAAVVAYKACLGYTPHCVEAMLGLGTCLKELPGPQNQQEAEAVLHAAVEAKPSSALARGTLAGVLYDKGDLRGALHEYGEAVRLDPHLLEAWNNAGNVLRDLGRLEEAVRAYLACITVQCSSLVGLVLSSTAPAAGGAAPVSPAAAVVGAVTPATVLAVQPGAAAVVGLQGQVVPGAAAPLVAGLTTVAGGAAAPAGLAAAVTATTVAQLAASWQPVLMTMQEQLLHPPHQPQPDLQQQQPAATSQEPMPAGQVVELQHQVAGDSQARQRDRRGPATVQGQGNANGQQAAGGVGQGQGAPATQQQQQQQQQQQGRQVAQAAQGVSAPAAGSQQAPGTTVIERLASLAQVLLVLSPLMPVAQACRLAVVYGNLGGVLRLLGKSLESVMAYEAVALLQPWLPEASANLGAVYKDVGRHEAAILPYRRALALRPHYPEALANLVHSLQSVCDWREQGPLLARMVAEAEAEMAMGRLPPVQPFHAMAYPVSPQFALALSAAYAAACQQAADKLATLAGLSLPLPHPPPVMPPSGRLRIGYVSADFGNHPLSHLMGSVFGLHDRSRFEVFCYALSPSDASPWRARVEAGADHFVDVSAMGAPEIAQRISSDGIHIAINLNGYTKGGRNEIFAMRPAPVQASYMGFPATMGAAFMPWLITDSVVAPPAVRGPGAGVYSESLVLLPHSYFVNNHKEEFADMLLPRHQWKSVPTREEIGLPVDKVVYACSNQCYKLDPATLTTWTNILRRVPHSVLWLLRFPPAGEPHVRSEVAARGVDPSRVIFTDVAPKELHVRRSCLGDVFLDTPLVNAHTTGCDVLWAGCPMITLPGTTMASRVAASLATATGLGREMVVGSLQEYEDRAVELGWDVGQREALRSRLLTARATCPLFDTARWVRNYERGLTIMWERHCRGEAPDTFEVHETHQAPASPATPPQVPRPAQAPASPFAAAAAAPPKEQGGLGRRSAPTLAPRPPVTFHHHHHDIQHSHRAPPPAAA